MKERRDKKRKRKASSSSQKQPAKRSKTQHTPVHVQDLESKSGEIEKENNLNVKSVLKLSGELNSHCLLFLKRRQSVAVQGKVEVRPLIGSVDVLGQTLVAGQKNYQIFSPLTSSLLTLTDSSIEDGNRSEQLCKFKELVKNQSSDLAKKSLLRARKAASVVLLCQLQDLVSDFVSHYEPFCNIFSSTTNKEDDTKQVLTKIESALKKKTSQLGFQLLEPDCERFKVVAISDQWNVIARDIQEAIRNSEEGSIPPVILLCGGKDVGKSTFARFLVNKLLNSCDAVCFLECDAGQTEFTPPGLLSLNRVTEPLLGLPFTHLAEPERSYFYGDLSPKDRPDDYIQCIHSLYGCYRKTFGGRCPLIINTQGWIKGMGLPLLLDVIRISNPTHIVQFRSSQPPKNLPTITKEFLLNSPGWRFPASFAIDTEPFPTTSNEQCIQEDAVTENSEGPVTFELKAYCKEDSKHNSCYRASDQRTLAILSYFSGLTQDKFVSWVESQTQVAAPDVTFKWSPAPLTSCVPYRVPWHSVAISVLHTEVPRSQIMYSLNATIVGLAVMDSDEASLETQEMPEVPQLIQNTITSECVGLGIIRNIDPVNKLFYILTPVPRDKLEKVNLLQKGSLEIPTCLLLQDKNTHAPYISSQFTFHLRGAGARKVRYNLLRKKFECTLLKEGEPRVEAMGQRSPRQRLDVLA